MTNALSPVGFWTERELTVPADTYNEDGLAVLIATGGRYNGEWVINIICHSPADDSHPQIVGSVHTERTENPDMAADTARAWMDQECDRLGLKVIHYVSHNDKYGPAERPYFTTSQIVVASKDWR